MGVRDLEAARDVVLAADVDIAPMNHVCEAALAALRRVVPCSAAAFMTVDGETVLPTGGVVHGFDPAACGPFWDSELLDPDFLKFRDLARSSDPVGTLVEATDGDLTRSPRFSKLYAELDVVDELRIALLAGSECIAVVTMLRSADDGPVTEFELADVRALLPTLAQVVRRALRRVGEQGGGPSMSPAVVLLDAEGRISAVTEGGTQLLDDLRTDGVDEEGLPAVVRTAAMRARWSRRGSRLALRVRGRSGRWMRLDVQPMEGDVGTVAVTVSPARASDLFTILLSSYDLTERESAVTLLLVRGLSSREIGAELSISPHTVRDHVKSIYAKTAVSSRGELVATLFSNHVLDQFHASVDHVV